MEIINAEDKRFRNYGRLITEVNFAPIVEAMESMPIPENVVYEPGLASLESTSAYSRIREICYGETDIQIKLDLDGTGKSEVDTGIGFFNHMLDGFSRHGLFDLNLTCKGDLEVDSHHTVEDCGIVLGEAIKEAIGDKAGIKRYGQRILPMDDALVLCAIDLSGRPFLNFNYSFENAKVGEFDTELVREFFYAISYSAGMNLHIKVLDGFNTHHIIEAMFKAFGKALDEATTKDERIEGALSTKGTL